MQLLYYIKDQKIMNNEFAFDLPFPDKIYFQKEKKAYHLCCLQFRHGNRFYLYTCINL